jgi:endonuclease G
LQSDSTSPHLFLGNPSLASLSAPDNYLIEKPQYALSYNNSLRIANWASWQLNAGWLGDEPRGKFAPDLTLPDTFVRVLPSDYREYSGIFDRGHLCPSGDRRRSREDNDATFLMSNIIPQACGNNQGPWEKLESYARRLAGQGRDLYIIAGGAGTKERIGEKRINVPQHTWKVMVVLPETGLSPEDVTVDTRAIAVVMPNVSDIRDDAWMSFVRTIEDVEKMTGYDFLRRIPEPARSALRKKRNAEGEAYE